jgi:hypothetical protein
VYPKRFAGQAHEAVSRLLIHKYEIVSLRSQ